MSASGLFVLAMVSPASAQAGIGPTAGVGDVPADARFEFGPVSVTPRLAVTDVGVESNVFRNESGPQRDYTARVAPGVDSWLQVGPVLLSSQTTLTYNYFRRFANQRSFDLEQGTRVTLLFTRLAPYVSWQVGSTRRRTSLEIDERVRQKLETISAGARLNLSSVFSVAVEGRQATTDFGDGDFGDPLLANELNRTEQTTMFEARLRVTPLTSLLVGAERQQDRFDESTLRNSDSMLYSAGVAFEPSALISGHLRVGIRRFDTTDPSVSDRTGVMASADVSYTWNEMTRVSVTVGRDVDYSFREVAPYYVFTTTGITLTQVLGTNWDVVARYSRLHLDYQRRADVDQIADDEVLPGNDNSRSYGGGIGRHLASGLRIGFDVDREIRASSLLDRNFVGYRAGGSVTYGF
jgi:hypothetical protein